MNLYGLLLFVHVFAVIMWLGTGIVFQALAEGALGGQTPDPDRLRTLFGVGDVFGPAFFGVITAVVLASGLWMVFDAGWGFDEPFVLGGLVGIVASGAIGGAVIGRTSEQIRDQFRASGGVSSDIVAGATKLRNFGRLDLAIMVIVVFLMTVKPGT